MNHNGTGDAQRRGPAPKTPMNLFFLSLRDLFHGLGSAFSLLGQFWFLVLTPILYEVFLTVWLDHVQGRYASGVKYILLELIPPREVEKSPKLMESVFSGLAGIHKNYNTYEVYAEGMFVPPLSLEIVSDSGAAHLYIRTAAVFRNLVEANFFAHYPDMEIVEVPDYVKNAPATIPNDKYELWGSDFELNKPDLYPIKTYKSFEEEVTGKMIDPLGALLEVMGKLPPGQTMWLQFIIAPEKDSWWKDKGKGTIELFLGKAKKESGGILADILDILRNLLKAFTSTPEFEKKKEDKNDQPLEFRLSPGEKDVLKALESNLGKQMFRVKMRMVYFGLREGFTKTFVSMFLGAMRQFSDNNLNGFRPEGVSKTQADFLFVTERLRFLQRRIYRRYISRDRTPSSKQFNLSVEELATVFHPPDLSVMAPSLTRVSAKRGTAPSNLPVLED
ncbi:MAG TPA: hypothetical protein VN420_04770 [Candidatus Fimivivens sp.]|nr:hypothetical protein [Candidatus Fimivivens sp.]